MWRAYGGKGWRAETTVDGLPIACYLEVVPVPICKWWSQGTLLPAEAVRLAKWNGRVSLDDVYIRDNPTLDDAVNRLDRSEMIGLALGRTKGLRPMRADRLAALGLPRDKLTPEELQEIAAPAARRKRNKKV